MTGNAAIPAGRLVTDDVGVHTIPAAEPEMRVRLPPSATVAQAGAISGPDVGRAQGAVVHPTPGHER